VDGLVVDGLVLVTSARVSVWQNVDSGNARVTDLFSITS